MRSTMRQAATAFVLAGMVISGCQTSSPDPDRPAPSQDQSPDQSQDQSPDESPDESPAPGKGSAPGSSPSPSEAGTATPSRSLEVYVDAWSAALVGTETLQVEYTPRTEVDVDDTEDGDDTEDVDDGRGRVTATLEPVTIEQVQGLAAGLPGLIEDVAARTLNAARDMSCNPQGCATATVDYPLEVFTTPDLAGSVGEILDTAGAETMLLRAVVDVPAGTDEVRFSLDGLDDTAETSLIVNDVVAGRLDESVLTDDPPEVTSEAQLGYGRDVYLLAAGFGQMFFPDPLYAADTDGTDDDGSRLYRTPAVSQTVSEELDVAAVDLADVAAARTTPLIAGPAVDDPAAAQLTPSQLTAMSSLTTGCLVGPVCSPQRVEVDVTQEQLSLPVRVCRDGLVAGAQVSSQDVTVELPGPVHQAGMWGGRQQLPDASSGLLSGRPVTVDGELRMLVRRVNIYTEDPSGEPALVEVYGRAYELGVDEIPQPDIDDLLGRWQPCPDTDTDTEAP